MISFRCQLCDATDVARVELHSGGIEISCGACGAASFIAADRARDPTPAATPAEPAATDGGYCPKCDAQVSEDAEACGSCGLRRDLFAEFASDAEHSAPQTLVAMWTALEANWSDAEAHDKFVAAASAAHAFGYAGRVYRRADRERGGDAIAKTRLSRIARMAEAAILAKPLDAPEIDGVKSYKGALMMMVMILLLAVGGGLYLLSKRGDDGGTTNKPPAVTDPASKTGPGGLRPARQR